MSKNSYFEGNRVTYRDVLLQSALRENAIEFRSQLPLCQDCKHHTLQYHGFSPLKRHESMRSKSVSYLGMPALA